MPFTHLTRRGRQARAALGGEMESLPPRPARGRKRREAKHEPLTREVDLVEVDAATSLVIPLSTAQVAPRPQTDGNPRLIIGPPTPTS